METNKSVVPGGYDNRPEPNVLTFEARRLPEFVARLAPLQKTAHKLGVPPFTFEEIGREVRTERAYISHEDEESGGYVPTFEMDTEREYVTIRVSGSTPQLPGGWAFLGAVEHSEEGNMIHGDAPELASYRTARADCQHCNYVRNRRKTVILKSEDGRIVQVGSSCLKDFLGYHGNPERIVSLMEALRELCSDAEDEEREFYGRGCEVGTLTDVFLTAVCACVRSHGWVPKSAYSGISTSVLVQYVLGDLRPTKYDEELKSMVASVQITDADKLEAQNVKEWARTIPADTMNNYLGNVRTALLSSYVLQRHYGIAASAVSARRTDEEKAREREEREGKRVASQHFGTVGERLTLKVTVDFVRSFETDYGTKYLVTMTTEDGNQAKTFSTGSFGRSAKRGDVLTIKGTVKEHEDYKGTLSTMLTRVSVIEDHSSED